MSEEKKSKEEFFFEDIVKKSKTGISFPKSLRDELFGENQEIFFKMIVPQEKDKIILEIISEGQAKLLSEKLKTQKPKITRPQRKKINSTQKKSASLSPNWGEYFIYDFEAKDKIKPILESAFYKFAEKPPNLEDAMGRVKYCLISFLTSTKTENAKIYYAVLKFLLDIIERFNQPNLLNNNILCMVILKLKVAFSFSHSLLIEVLIRKNKLLKPFQWFNFCKNK